MKRQIHYNVIAAIAVTIGIYFLFQIKSQKSNNKIEKDMSKESKSIDEMTKGQFEYDLTYLGKKDQNLILLSDKDKKGMIIISPKYQAKVFTSSTNGLTGHSLGWVNYKAFETQNIDEHMNAYGGENRLWIGPEGGKYSIYFKPGTKQDFSNWHTPSAIDTEAWAVKDTTGNSVALEKEMKLENYKSTKFDVLVRRTISLLDKEEVSKLLSIDIPTKVNSVAYSTENTITNKTTFDWTKETGTLCIWMLDMYPPSNQAYTIIPYKKGDEKELGQIVKSNYFGEIPTNRLTIKDGVIFFKTDGKYRSKLGLRPSRAMAIAGNYDIVNKRLTITTFSMNKDKDVVYLNQSWDTTQDPLTGCTLNAYNDGPLEDNSQMGPFLELESVSPAAFLKPNEQLSHSHVVYHFSGDEAALDVIIQKLLHTSIAEIQQHLF